MGENLIVPRSVVLLVGSFISDATRLAHILHLCDTTRPLMNPSPNMVHKLASFWPNDERVRYLSLCIDEDTTFEKDDVFAFIVRIVSFAQHTLISKRVWVRLTLRTRNLKFQFVDIRPLLLAMSGSLEYLNVENIGGRGFAPICGTGFGDVLPNLKILEVTEFDRGWLRAMLTFKLPALRVLNFNQCLGSS